MRARVAVLVAVFAFLFGYFAYTAGSQVGIITLAPATRIDPGGAVEGGDAIYLPHGDVLNVRNVQGGTVDDPNLDVGAGSSTNRGDLSINYDVGRCTYVYDGHATDRTRDRHVIAAFCPGKRPWFKQQPRIGGRPPH